MRDKLQKLMHFLAAVVMIIHALNHMESGDGSTFFYLFLGILVLTIAFYQEKIESKNRFIAGSFYWMEGIVLLFIAFEYFENFKHILPLVYLLLAITYFAGGYFMMLKKGKARKRQKS